MNPTQERLRRWMLRHLRNGFVIEQRLEQSIVPLVLEKGIWFHDRLHSNSYPVTDEWRKNNRPKIKRCFFNSQDFCLVVPEGRYFDGFAYKSEEPFHPW